MKKLIKIIVSAAALMLFGICARAQEVPYGTPEIDGVMDEIYNSCEAIATNVLVTKYTATDGSRVTMARMLWDYDGLSIYAEIEEKTPSDVGSEDYTCDSFEVFTDELHIATTQNDNNQTQYRVTRSGRTSVALGAVPDFENAVKISEDKYAVEVKLPWVCIVPSEGHVMGFDIAVNDGDYSGTRTSVMQWYSSSALNYIDSSVYGEITLVYGENYKPYAEDKRAICIDVSGRRVDCGGTDPVIEDGRTLIPVRAVFEALDADVVWNGKERAAYSIGHGKLIKLFIDSDTAYVNNEPKTLDVPARIINDRTMVPIRFIAETFGYDVSFDDYTGVIYITGS